MKNLKMFYLVTLLDTNKATNNKIATNSILIQLQMFHKFQVKVSRFTHLLIGKYGKLM